MKTKLLGTCPLSAAATDSAWHDCCQSRLSRKVLLIQQKKQVPTIVLYLLGYIFTCLVLLPILPYWS